MVAQFAIIGGGWRAEAYLRVARESGGRFEVCAVAEPNVQRAEYLKINYSVNVVDTIDAVVAKSNPKFLVLCLPQIILVKFISEALEKKIPILTETFLDKTGIESIINLYNEAEKTGYIQIAEQYWRQPIHAARLKVIESGILGDVFEAQISVGHGYHGISLIRKYLDIMYEPCTITGKRFVNKIVRGPDRYYKYPETEMLVDNPQDFAIFDFGEKWAVFDFADPEQYYSSIRRNRLLIRGTKGEIADNEVRYLSDFKTPIEFTLKRIAHGVDGNMWGPHIVGITGQNTWYYENEYGNLRLSDDEIAILHDLESMRDFSDSGKGFYSLAEGCQDQYLNFMMRKALETGEKVKLEKQIWAQ
jgi:hypothetical protein